MKLTRQARFTVVFCLLLSLLLTSCAKQPVTAPDAGEATVQPLQAGPAATGDLSQDPVYLCDSGNRYLESKSAKHAKLVFLRAHEIDPGYIPALTGLSQVYLLEGDGGEALRYARMARAFSVSRSDRVLAAINQATALYSVKPEDWFFQLLALDKEMAHDAPDNSGILLIVARAYRDRGDFTHGTSYYTTVIKQAGPDSALAEQELSDMFARHLGGSTSKAGKNIVLIEQISRGDAAIILIEELDLFNRVKRTDQQDKQAQFQTPQQYARPKKPAKIPADLAEHHYGQDIYRLMDYSIRGFELGQDGKFYPEAPISGASLAMAMEDVLVLLSGKGSSGTSYLGQPSPFSDVPSGHFAFNAIMVVTSRQILPADADGSFRPDGKVSGAELLLAIQKVNNVVQP